ncbi:hypothetical protein QBC44DRAFT_382648, partial [Cladorrhinum sp. PSN332]
MGGFNYKTTAKHTRVNAALSARKTEGPSEKKKISFEFTISFVSFLSFFLLFFFCVLWNVLGRFWGGLGEIWAGKGAFAFAFLFSLWHSPKEEREGFFGYIYY